MNQPKEVRTCPRMKTTATYASDVRPQRKPFSRKNFKWNVERNHAKCSKKQKVVVVDDIGNVTTNNNAFNYIIENADKIKNEKAA